MRIILLSLFASLVLICHGQETLSDSSYTLNGNRFTVILQESDTNSFVHIVKNQTDTINSNGIYSEFEILHFDADPYPDILLYDDSLTENYPAALFLFDSVNGTYRQVQGFRPVADCVPIESNSRYYISLYSYWNEECSLQIWTSKLFYIENYWVHEIGEMRRRGCNSEKVIDIYKVVTTDKRILVESIPSDTLANYSGYELGFTDEYWNENFEKFIK